MAGPGVVPVSYVVTFVFLIFAFKVSKIRFLVNLLQKILSIHSNFFQIVSKKRQGEKRRLLDLIKRGYSR